MLERLAPVMGSLPPYFTTTRSNSLRGLGVGHDLRAGAELQLKRAGEHDRRQLVAEQDGDGVLVAGPELADDACIALRVGQADAQDR